MDRSTSGFGRRRLLAGAGLAAVAGVGIAAARGGDATPDDRAASRGAGDSSPGLAAAVTALNVREAPYRAAGDGSADDGPAIQRALDDAGDAGGGAVFLPPGDYAVKAALVPRARTLLFGTHAPRWGSLPESSCRIRAREDFDGEGLVMPAADSAALAISNLALVGDGAGSRLHGLRMPDLADATEEQSLTLRDLSIYGFSGDGVFGRVWVALLENCYIHDNAGWGINSSEGNRWNDAHVSNCFLFYNRLGNLYFGGSEESAAVEFVNTRFERAGTNPEDVFSPLQPDAPGVRLASAHQIHFVNCSTDANSGSGFELISEPDSPDFRPSNVTLTSCRFSRDGTGAQDELGDFAGVKVVGRGDAGSDSANQIKLANCIVTYGTVDDEGGDGLVGPKFGVWYENTFHFQWIGGNIEAPDDSSRRAFHVGRGANFRPQIVDLVRGLLTLPQDEPAPVSRPPGAVYLDAAGSQLRVWDGERWLSTPLT